LLAALCVRAWADGFLRRVSLNTKHSKKTLAASIAYMNIFDIALFYTSRVDSVQKGTAMLWDSPSKQKKNIYIYLFIFFINNTFSIYKAEPYSTGLDVRPCMNGPIAHSYAAGMPR
jgi:hypothetical protein